VVLEATHRSVANRRTVGYQTFSSARALPSRSTYAPALANHRQDRHSGASIQDMSAVCHHRAPRRRSRPARVLLDRPAQHLVMRGQRQPRLLGVRLPPTGRTLNIGEQKCHHPRRGHRLISGHPRSMAQAMRPHFEHRGLARTGLSQGRAYTAFRCASPAPMAVAGHRARRSQRQLCHRPARDRVTSSPPRSATSADASFAPRGRR
jgi:hypothetical protein